MTTTAIPQPWLQATDRIFTGYRSLYILIIMTGSQSIWTNCETITKTNSNNNGKMAIFNFRIQTLVRGPL